MTTTTMSQLEMQLQSARKSILFMETQHANTLRGLHQEIQQLQKKCSEQTFELAMRSEEPVQDSSIAARLAQHERDVQDLVQEKIGLVQKLESRERQLVELDEHIKQQERKYLNQLKIDKHRITALVNELDTRTNTITYQNMQLQLAHSKLSQKSKQFASSLAPTPPAKPRKSDSRNSIRIPSRSVDAQTRPVSSNDGRPRSVTAGSKLSRPASTSSAELTPREPQSTSRYIPSPMPDPTPFLTAGEKAGEVADPVFVTTRRSALPPIRSKHDAPSGEDLNGNRESARWRQPYLSGDKASREGEKLALGRALSADRKMQPQPGVKH